MNLKDFNSTKKYHALHLGPSGSGKTCAGVTVGDCVNEITKEIKYSRVRVLDIDNRIKGIFGLPELHAKISGGFIEYEQYNQTDPGSRAKKLSDDLEAVKASVIKGQLDTVILSSTTSATDLYREQARHPSSGIKHNLLLGRIMTQVQDYGYIDRAHRDVIVGDLNKLNCHVIIEAHFCDDGYTKDTAEGEVFVVTGKKVNVPGKLSQELPTWFDETVEFSIDETIVNQPRYLAKFRGKFAKTSIPNLPVEINWTGKNFFKLISEISTKKEMEVKK